MRFTKVASSGVGVRGLKTISVFGSGFSTVMDANLAESRSVEGRVPALTERRAFLVLGLGD